MSLPMTDTLPQSESATTEERGVKRPLEQEQTADNDTMTLINNASAKLPLATISSKSKRSRSSKSSRKQRDKDVDDSSSSSADKKKRRRRRQKRHSNKGYYEMTEIERGRQEARILARLERNKARMLAKGHMLAPYNSTQFLINDAEDDKVRRLDEALHDDLTSSTDDLHGKQSPSGSSCGKIRSRNSSFSVEDEEDYFYSSPDDEEEFLSKEFSKDYEKGSVDRLEQMEKNQLILEYLGMEKRVEALEKRLEEIQDREAMKALTGEVDYEFARGEVPMEPETAEKIKVFQQEIRKLIKENKNLHMENARLKRKLGARPSRSDSTSSEDDDDMHVDVAPNSIIVKDDAGKTEDTGYESTQSKEQTPERDLLRTVERHRDG